MKRLTKHVAILLTLTISLLSVSTAFSQDITDILFPAGGSSASVNGELTANDDTDQYRINAQAGQLFVANLISTSDAELNAFVVLAPEDDPEPIRLGETSFAIELPAAGNYIVSVTAEEEMAEGESVPYKLAIAILGDVETCRVVITTESQLNAGALAPELGITEEQLRGANPQITEDGTGYLIGDILVYPCAGAPSDNGGDDGGSTDGGGDDGGGGGSGGSQTYVIQPGDTLFSIGRRFGVSVSAIQAANGLGTSTLIIAGDTLDIPAGSGQVPGGPGSGGPDSYAVQPGDTLFSIAQRFGTTVSELQSANDLGSSTTIFAGQTLSIPGDATRGTHVVQPGETLFRIAIQYGTTVQTLQSLNNISNPNFITAGTVLSIP